MSNFKNYRVVINLVDGTYVHSKPYNGIVYAENLALKCAGKANMYSVVTEKTTVWVNPQYVITIFHEEA